MLQVVPGGQVVDVPPAPPPPVVAPKPPTVAVSPIGAVGGPSPGERDNPTGGTESFPNQGSDGGGTSGNPPTGGAPPTPPPDDSQGSATPDVPTFDGDLQTFNDSLKKPQGVGQLWNTMWTTIWTRPPDVHTKIQGLNDGTQDLFKSTPYIY